MADASLSVQPVEEGSRIQSRDGSGVGRGRSGSRARPSWLRRAMSGLRMRKQPAAAVDAPAPARARERAPRWRSALKAVGSALARAACICEPVCSGAKADDAMDPDWRYAFTGSSLSYEVLMQRFALEEEATRRRMEMREAGAREGQWYWFPPGPSRLSQMSLAEEEEDDDDDGENSSTSPLYSEADQSI